MKSASYDSIHLLALEQHGIFTAEQARAIGVPSINLVRMVKRGRLERLAYGLYRDIGAPASRWTPYLAATLWPQGTTGVVSHETALDLMELSDVNPARIHVTVSRRFRTHRTPPPGVVLHRANLADTDVTSIEGIPITTAARAIRDCATANLGPALIREAIEDARTKGWVTPAEAIALTTELIGAGKL